MNILMNVFVNDYESPDIKCPKCGSRDVVVSEDEHGYFWVSRCYRCSYVKEEEG